MPWKLTGPEILRLFDHVRVWDARTKTWTRSMGDRRVISERDICKRRGHLISIFSYENTMLVERAEPYGKYRIF